MPNLVSNHRQKLSNLDENGKDIGPIEENIKKGLF